MAVEITWEEWEDKTAFDLRQEAAGSDHAT